MTDADRTIYSLDGYDYELPADMIAQEPLPQRDRSKMMVLERRTGRLVHSRFYRLPEFLEPGDLLVLNDTRVIPARLLGCGAGSGFPAELLLLHREREGLWEAMVKPGRRLKTGARVVFPGGLEAVVEEYRGRGKRLVRFLCPGGSPEEEIDRLGRVPLPPYIKRELKDPELYQTVYAAREGSSAAPTAGLHFTPAVFKALRKRGVGHVFVTLHIGPGTFQPVRAQDIRDHSMHREYFSLSPESAGIINETRKRGRRVVAVGTTSCRVLEANGTEEGLVRPGEGWTDLFIYPGYSFRVVDALLTNFHLPRSTLLMLVSAFAGREAIMEAYRLAVEMEYRFYSFGDCMLIL
ncbi:MAG: tRNA preQ1(34) S-adenosylmethionine ribosyltransferase-isomerase QueA [Dethiobacteria bacterium]